MAQPFLQAFDSMRFVQQISEVSRPDRRMADEHAKPPIGRQCYAFNFEEDLSISIAKEEARARLLSGGFTEQADFKIWEDAIGNLFVMLFGTEQSLPAFMTQSHLDSVPDGGKYDGVIGVAFGLLVIDTFVRTRTRPKRSFVLFVPRGEESSPNNGVACVGSGYATRTLSWEKLENIEHTKGVLLSAHFGPERWARVRAEYALPPFVSPRNIAGSLEVHIEQSGFIEASDRDIGIVTSGVGGASRRSIEVPGLATHGVVVQKDAYVRCALRFIGFSAHTGATPPNPEHRGGTLYRKDALVASGRAVAALLKNDGVELVRSEPFKETGFTSVPSDQVVDLLVRAEEMYALRSQLANQQSDAERYYGVKMTYAIEPAEQGFVTVVDKDAACAAALFPTMVSARSTSAYQREGTELGLTRATITDFKLVGDALTCKQDGREVNPEAYKRLEAEIDGDLRMQFGSRFRVKVVSEKPSSLVDTELTNELIAQARETSVGNRPLTWLEMPSFPGHDLDRVIAAKIPGALLFLRHSGVSHNAGEDLPKKHLENGLRVALPFVLRKLAA